MKHCFLKAVCLRWLHNYDFECYSVCALCNFSPNILLDLPALKPLSIDFYVNVLMPASPLLTLGLS